MLQGMLLCNLLFLLAQVMPGNLILLSPPPDPCKNHMVVKKSPERSVSHVINHPTLCDKDLDGWYRFEQGEIATSCVPENHCTKSTIWMNDTFPTVSDGKQIKNFCSRVSFFGQLPQSCCNYQFTVNVINCGAFMTYEFIDTHLAGGLLPCPIVYCTDTILKVTSTQLIGPLRTRTGFQFKCSFDYKQPNTTAGIDFEVQWLFNNKPVASQVVTARSHIRSVTSNESLWVSHFGESLSCSVAVYHHGHLPSGITKHSNQYFGGIKIEPQPIILTEGEEIELTITATLPILCDNNWSWTRFCYLVLSIENNNKGVDLSTNTCEFTLTSQPNTLTATKPLRLRLNNIVLPYTDNHFNLSLQTQPHNGSLWNRQSFNLTITTKQTKPKKKLPNIDCTVFPDCHVFGFNKIRVSTIEYPGDFILYNSTMDTDNQLEVHIRQMVIDGETPTTCGVAMRYGDEIVFLDICTYKTVPVITRNSQEARLIVSQCDGNLYLISASNGAWLHVEVYKSKLAILLHGHLQKSTRNTDLCSLETTTSSMTKQQLLLFRLDRSQSLFRDRGRQSVVKNRTLSTGNCCSMGSTTCENITLNPLSMKRCNIITALHIGSTLDSEISKTFKERNWTWPTESGRFKNTSLTDCQMALTNGPPRMCFLGLITYLYMFNGACLNNVLKTDSMEGQVGIVQAFTWLCQTEALMNPNHSHHLNIPASEITTDICPNFCSFNGKCNKGWCNCHAGYTSEDCSVKSGTELFIVGILGGETCALSTGRCLQPTLLVKNFVWMNREHYAVHFIPIIFNKTMTTLWHEGSYLNLKHIDNTNAISLNVSSYKIKDGTEYGYRIFLFGSDGLTSNSIDYVIYDDRCRNCSSSKLVGGAVCTMKKNSCDIDNHCYSNDEVNPSNTILKCNPDKSQLHWSPV